MRGLVACIVFFLMTGCSSEKVVVGSVNDFCGDKLGCYKAERVLFVRVHSYWEAGSTVEEVTRRGYRLVDPKALKLNNAIAYCDGNDFCFESEVYLVICGEELRVIDKNKEKEATIKGCHALKPRSE